MDESKLKAIPEPDRTAFRQLVERCEKAEIEYEIEQEIGYLSIYLPSGREKRVIFVADAEDAGKLAQVKFERYVFIEGYEGICCYAEGYIEAYIRLLLPKSSEFLFSRLLNIPYAEIKKIKPANLVFEVKSKSSNGNQIDITISQQSNIISLLTMREVLQQGSDVTIKIGGLNISKNQQASDILEKLANSLFFQIEGSIGFSLMLETYYEEPLRIRSVPSTRSKATVIFPKYEYDRDPLNLYWYAKSASEMPLLQFLAYYQVLEFYFPTYSRKETSKVVTNILKDTTFDPNRDLDVNKVISAVLSRMGRGYADEKQQLRATIQACVESEEIRQFIEERDYIKDYFRSDFKKLSPLKVSVDNKELDLKDQIAERLYDIRCKIVHTKSGEAEAERIIPFTEEESLLPIEIDIIEFISRKALVSGSSKLSI
jgi:hypothetical protein